MKPRQRPSGMPFHRYSPFPTVGIDANMVTASLQAVLSAVNRLAGSGEVRA